MKFDYAAQFKYEIQAREASALAELEAIRYQLRGQPRPRKPLSHLARLSKKKHNKASRKGRKINR